MGPQIARLKRSIVTLVAFVCLFSTVHFQMYPQMACTGRCIVTLVAFMQLSDIANIFEILLHCHSVVCYAQIIAPNWVKFITDFLSPKIWIVHFSMAYFHFFIIERQMSWRQISCTNGQVEKFPLWEFSLGSFSCGSNTDSMIEVWDSKHVDKCNTVKTCKSKGGPR